MSDHLVKLSKFLSYVLRHRPDEIGITLGDQGWVDVDELLTKAKAAGHEISRQELQQVVDTSDKKRFSFSDDGRRIRAAQGHSVSVELGLTPQEPPAKLYHGTATRFLNAILREGLKAQARQHVHLSSDLDTATRVGQRHGKVVVLTVDAGNMHAAGFVFYRSDNGVWLTDKVPMEFLLAVPSDTQA